MSPAGDFISLKAAIDAGADAIYFGIIEMNMRANARNFHLDDLPEIVKLCHENSVKAYLALNTIIFDHEVEKARVLVKSAAAAGVDAVICWDFAILEAARDYNIESFISTQMSVANSSSIEFFYKNLGINRFVLARECTLDEMVSIKRNLERKLGREADNIELEVFAHGAMCVSVSGRCFMSQFHFNKSGNRGECKQPCRREYTITEERDGKSYLIGKDYVMSPKDVCSLPFLEKILEAGVVDSFKIEGRGRSPEYVSTVTSAYRQVIDFYYENRDKEGFAEELKTLKDKLYKELDSVFNRGFSDGFFFGRQIEEWTGGNGSKASHRKVQIGYVTNFYKQVGVAEIKVEGHEFKAGQELMFQGKTTGVLSQIAESIEIEGKTVEVAHQGISVGVKLSKPVKINDKVFIIVPIEELPANSFKQ
jgi:putative protease